jgi:hypothetical protein
VIPCSKTLSLARYFTSSFDLLAHYFFINDTTKKINSVMKKRMITGYSWNKLYYYRTLYSRSLEIISTSSNWVSALTLAHQPCRCLEQQEEARTCRPSEACRSSWILSPSWVRWRSSRASSNSSMSFQHPVLRNCEEGLMGKYCIVFVDGIFNLTLSLRSPLEVCPARGELPLVRWAQPPCSSKAS